MDYSGACRKSKVRIGYAMRLHREKRIGQVGPLADGCRLLVAAIESKVEIS